MSLLTVSDIRLEEQGNLALQDISFTQQRFQKLAVAGETGSGKSTLLQTIAGLVQPSAGTVLFEGSRVRGPAEKLIPGQAGIAYLSQQFELPQFLRVEQVLRYANKLRGNAAADLYDVCRINHLMQRRTDHLSGGERQRIALARLLLAAPRLLLLDESYSNLDRVHKQILKDVVRDLGEQLSITCTLVSHDPLDTLSWADELLVLRAGQLVQQGPPVQVYQQPIDEYTASLFGDYHLLTGPAARALTKAAGRRLPKGKQLLLRPEQVELTTAATEGATVATVQAVRFFGSYYETEVELLGSRFTVKSSTPPAAPGDAVAVSYPGPQMWFL
ncbi:ATP-binding cassette domain-containing protein [Hymenobacter defluvii]|uniref:ABC transporter ATP-binding protein n=1 Tax=Hymenobacter defluvii TaxID=2054411 RepID=A0ABS3TA52_9BACT|nr:ABC transporter ATP-binding protein [Hymenobacter defluvii]MBO3270512.1 ABC transporter ATP-binding protein [Hymenobacter defluvii]